jgi:hypothetical protein
MGAAPTTWTSTALIKSSDCRNCPGIVSACQATDWIVNRCVAENKHMPRAFWTHLLTSLHASVPRQSTNLGGNVMDPARFDRLVHALSSSRTRRRALGAALASALLSAAASAAPEPASCLAIGKRCRQAADARHGKSKRNGKHHPPACAKCCSRFGAAGSDGKARCSCKPEGEACDDASQCCGGRCRAGNCTGCAAATKPCQGACIPETSCCPTDADGAPCGVGGLCDDGRCFLAYPNCEGTCGTFGVAAGSGGVNFCTSGSDDQSCNSLACNATADCPAGQWCAVLAACGNHCVDGCPA